MADLRPAERALVERIATPEDAQAWLDGLAFNDATPRTLRSFRGVLEHGTAHCIEGALAAAYLLERHGHPPLLLDLWSEDEVDHVVFLWRGPDGWGAVGKSRFPGLQGRRPVFRTVRDLAWSYVDPYVDETGRVQGYATYDLRACGPSSSWALSPRNLWRIERALLANEVAPLRASDARHERWLARYRAWKRAHAGGEPPASFYADADRFLGTADA